MDIENFKVKEFLAKDKYLINEYTVALSYLAPVETKRKLIALKLGEVEQLKRIVNSENDDDIVKVVSMAQGISGEDVLNMGIINFFGLLNSVRYQLQRIFDAEINGLSGGATDVKWEMVDGSKVMSVFGILNTLFNLDKDPKKHKWYMKQKYSYVFLLLKRAKTKRDLEDAMSKIKLTAEG